MRFKFSTCSIIKIRLRKLAEVYLFLTGFQKVPGLILDCSLLLTLVPPDKCQYSTLNFATLLIPTSSSSLVTVVESFSALQSEVLAALLSTLQISG